MFRGRTISWGCPSATGSSLSPSARTKQGSAWQPVSSRLWLRRGDEWFVEPLMEKEDTLNHECQKLKLNFRIYSWSKLPFALLKCRWISAKAMEPLKAPINLVSEEEASAWQPSPRLLLWGLGAPTKALGCEVTVPQAPRGRRGRVMMSKFAR